MATISDLLRNPKIRLEPVWIPDPHAQLLWVAASDLEDPTPFLEEHVVLLLTGIGKTDWQAPQWRSYLQRLHEKNICALGIATNLYLPELPKAVADLARDLQINLFIVPEETTFLAITREIAAALEADELVGARRLPNYQDQLIQIMRQGKREQVVQFLAELLQLPVSLDRAGDAANSASPHSQAHWVEYLGSATNTSYELHVHLPEKQRAELPLWQRQLVTMASALLTFDLATEAERMRALQHAHSYAFGLLLEGNWDSLKAVIRMVYPRAQSFRGRGLIIAMRAQDSNTANTQLLNRAWRAISELPATVAAPPIARVQGEYLEVALPQLIEPAVLAALKPFGLPIGVGTVGKLAEINTSRETALAAVNQAASAAEGITRWDDLFSSGLSKLIDPVTTAAFTASFLAPIRAHSAAAELLQVLEAFIDSCGNRSYIAHYLHLHRNTVTARIEKLEQLLGRSLDDPAVRTQAWLALHLGK